jgi:hypothetical protein
MDRDQQQPTVRLQILLNPVMPVSIFAGALFRRAGVDDVDICIDNAHDVYVRHPRSMPILMAVLFPMASPKPIAI